jgi:methyltransferase (TIGR00027 family)
VDVLANTSRWMAAIRAYESQRPDALFTDPLASALAGEEGRRMLGPEYSALANSATYVAIRTRFFDDFISRLVPHELKQVAIVAAGMDARAFRLAWPTEISVYELDRPELLRVKEEILSREAAQSQCSRRALGVNIESDWIQPLMDAGFAPDEPSLWIVEGLFVYLEERSVQRILSQISSTAASGSGLCCDFVSNSFLTSPWMTDALSAMATMGTPWRSAADDPEALLASHGWRAEVREPGEPEVSRHRWPYPVMPRIVPGVPRSFLVTARKS